MPRISERALLLLLAAIQCTHIMDFMVMMPLGPQLMRELGLNPGQFSGLVAAYTLAAGVVGMMAAPFIDRVDRRPLLLLTYAGFLVGTLACGLAHTHGTLLAARLVCGMFGGISGTLVMAIVADVVPPERRASGMGVVMTAFSAAAALGVPAGLFLAQKFRWEMPFFVVAGAGALVWLALLRFLPAVRGHLSVPPSERRGAFLALFRNANAGWAMLFMAAMVLGHMTIVPLLSPFLVRNTGFPESKLFLVYLVGGVLTIFTSPLVGRLADRYGRMRVLAVLIAIACAVILLISHSGPAPMALMLVKTGLFFVFASGRFVPAQAISSLAVSSAQRGGFMSLSTCVRDLASGAAAGLAGWVVVEGSDGLMHHFDRLGWIAVSASLIGLWIGSRVRAVDDSPGMTLSKQPPSQKAPPSPIGVA